MANPWRGDVELIIDGMPYKMKLTLGALAELEASLKCGSLIDLVARFEEGRFTTRDILALLLAGLRGGGWKGDATTLAGATIEGGPMGGAKAAALLLARAFMLPGERENAP